MTALPNEESIFRPFESPGVRSRPDIAVLDWANAVEAWQPLNADTEIIGLHDDHIIGTKSLQFDKVGLVDSFAGVKHTGLNLNLERFGAYAAFELIFSADSASNLYSQFQLSIGTDEDNCAQWFIHHGIPSTEWAFVSTRVRDQRRSSQLGTGLDLANVDYMAVKFFFNSSSNILSSFYLDSLTIKAA